MSGNSSLRDERINTNLRMRRATRRAVDEMSALLGGLSRDDTVNFLLRGALAAQYERLGITRDPAVTAAELLRVIGVTWETDLSDDEVRAFGIVQGALARVIQFRARETGD